MYEIIEEIQKECEIVFKPAEYSSIFPQGHYFNDDKIQIVIYNGRDLKSISLVDLIIILHEYGHHLLFKGDNISKTGFDYTIDMYKQKSARFKEEVFAWIKGIHFALKLNINNWQKLQIALLSSVIATYCLTKYAYAFLMN